MQALQTETPLTTLLEGLAAIGHVDFDAVEVGFKEKDLKSEEEVGILESEEVRNVWVLVHKNRRRLIGLRAQEMRICADLLEAPGGSGSEEPVGLRQVRDQYFLLSAQVEALNSLFWSCVRATFPQLVRGGSVGLREGWMVITKSTTPEDEAGSFVIPVLALQG